TSAEESPGPNSKARGGVHSCKDFSIHDGDGRSRAATGSPPAAPARVERATERAYIWAASNPSSPRPQRLWGFARRYRASRRRLFYVTQASWGVVWHRAG